MKRIWKQIGSLFLSVCMVVTLLPTVAFAETDTKTSSVATQEALKSALESETATTVTVTASFTLTNAVEVKADHTLLIDNGVTLQIGDTSSSQLTLTVPNAKTLTVSGGGTLEVCNTTTLCGVLVIGSMIISGGNLTVKNTSNEYTCGVWGIGSLLIEGNSVLSVENTGANTGIQGNVTIKDSSATISSTNNNMKECFGIEVSALTIDNSTVAISNSSSSSAIAIRSARGDILLKNGAHVTAAGQGGGIYFFTAPGSLVVDGSTLELQSETGLYLNFLDGVSFTGLNSGVIKLAQGLEIDSANGKMKDQDCVLTSRYITVGAADAKPSANGLTAGDYVWDGTYFTKGSGSATPPALGSNASISSDITENSQHYAGNGNGTSGLMNAIDASTYGSPVGNTLSITSGDFTGNNLDLYGGYTNRQDETAANNEIIVNGGNFGGEYQFVSGGEAVEGNSTNNTVTINAFSGIITRVCGNGKSSGGDATGNNIVINGGQGSIDTVWGANALHNATGNTVEIGGTVTVSQEIIGGIATLGSATGNTVTISGHPDLLNARLLGGSGYDAISIDTFTGNVLNMNASRQTVKGLGNFEYYNFMVPSSLSDGGVMLTVTDGDGYNQPVDLNNTSIEIRLMGTASLALWDKIVLIDSSAKGLSGTPTNATAAVSGYSFAIAVENNKLIATVTETPTQFYTVTFDLNGGTRTGGGKLRQGVPGGGSAAAPSVTRNSYTFTGWDKAFTNVTSNLIVKANWSYNGSSGDSDSGGGSSSGSSSTVTAPGKTPNQPVMATAPVTATAGTKGSASATIPEKSVTDAIAKAQADAKVQGKTANGTTVALNVTMPKGTTSLTANLTRNSLNSLVSAGVTSLELNGSPVTVSFDTKALAEIQKQSSGNISITIAPKASLSASAKTMIGTRPVYDLTVSYIKDGKNAAVSSFGSGTATVSVPYTPAKGEAIGGLYAVYVDTKGNATRIAGSAYDVNSKNMIFTTTHFSRYGIGYTAPSAKFTDIKTHWGKESIDYVVGRGLLSGTAETTFAPDTAMTRGMLVTALGRLANVDTKAYTTNSFTDVTADSAFRPYIEWTYKKGIIQGAGNGKFEPNRAVTREEIAVIFTNYAKATGYTLPVTRTATTYADASSIGSTYKTAVTAMQQAGIMMGGSGNKFNPKASATRAEVSSMLHRYIKLTIDPATAQGWARNDAGQYLYYKDGKAVTNTQTIDGVKYFFNTDGTLKTGWVKDGDNKRYYFNIYGNMVSGKWLRIDGKWYYFNADGSLAVSTKIGEYEVDENGVRKDK